MDSVIQRLKGLPLLEKLVENNGDDALTDEQILNVFRFKIQEGERVLKTREVAEELPITPNWTGKRLNKLEEKGRVHSKSAGQGDVWWIDDDEPKFPVSEGMGAVGEEQEARRAQRRAAGNADAAHPAVAPRHPQQPDGHQRPHRLRERAHRA